MSKKTPINTLSRRAFLKRGCAAIASLPTMATMANLTLTSRALAETAGSLEGYKALVCVFLHGGNDSFNMLVPYENSADFNEYGDYVTIRESLALPRSELLAINDPMSGRQFGVNATMPDMHDLYNQGDLAFLANVGSLIQPTTRDDYNNGIQIPYKLFSHSDQQNQWQTAKPGSHILTSGWAGRALDILTGSTADPNDVFMNISLGGSNRLQTGASVFPYTVDAINSAVLRKMDYGSSVAESTFNTILDATLSENYNDHLLQKTYAEMNRDAVDFAVQMKAATDAQSDESVYVSQKLDSGGALRYSFPNTSLGDQLKMIARIIASRTALNSPNRQIFYLSMGGFDTHDDPDNDIHKGLLSTLNNALIAFSESMKHQGLNDSVTTFTMSDFGRTLTSNGKGSDHAWGGNHMIMGGAVKGGRVYGEYPETLTASNGLEAGGRGRLLPTRSVTEYYADLALWLGVAESDLYTVLPDLGAFRDAKAPLGFMV